MKSTLTRMIAGEYRQKLCMMPLEGGPFVTTPGGKDAIAREPRARTVEE